jgi:hypothetical protein
MAGSPHGAGLGGGGGEARGHDAMVWQAAPPAGRAAGAVEPAFHRVTEAGGVDLAVHPPGGLSMGKGGAVGPFDPAAALRETGPRRRTGAER